MKSRFLFLILFLTSIGHVFGQNEAIYVAEMSVVLDAPHHSSHCSNYFDISIYNVDNALVTTWRENIGSERATFTKNIAETKGFKNLTIEAERRWNRFSCNRAGGSGTITPTFTITGATQTSTFSIPGWTDNSSLRIFLYPKEIGITASRPSYDVDAPSDAYSLPTVDAITLSATPGFHSSTYQWQYSFTGQPNDWDDLPSVYNGNQQISVSGKDIFGSAANALNRVRNHKNIYFRIKPPHANTDSRVILLDMVPSAPHITSVDKTDAKCNGAAEGIVTLHFDRDLLPGEEIIGLVDNMSYQNVTSYTNRTITFSKLQSDKTHVLGLLGHYKVDNYSHTTYTDGPDHTKTVTINSPPVISFNSNGSTNILCYGGNDGSFKVNASGGVGNYKIHWKEQSASSYSDKQFDSTNEVTISNLRAGTYTFYVSDANGCFLRDAGGYEATESVTLTQPATGLNITHYESEHPSGHGLSNGSITVIADGGSGNYTYSWKNGNGVTINTASTEFVNGEHRYKLSNIPAGSYTVTIYDTNGCSRQESYSLSQPDPLIVSIQETTSIKCNGDNNGALSTTVNGGVPGSSGYSYRWSMETNGSYTDLSFEYGSTLLYRGAGNYKVVITDNSRIPNTSEAFFTLAEPSIVELQSLTLGDVTCHGASNGTAQITAQGGGGNYTINYRKEGEFSYKTVSSGASASAVISNLTEGDYYFNLRDVNGCVASFPGGGDMMFTINQPATPVKIQPYESKNTSGYGRSDGFVSYKVEGGVPNNSSPLYNIQWKNQNGQVVTPVNSIVDGIFVTRIEDIPKGTYTLEVRDKNSCYISAIAVIDEPAQLKVDWNNSKLIDCTGEATGELIAKVQGGIPYTGAGVYPYKFQWYKVVNGVDSAYTDKTDSILSDLSAGDYKVIIEDGSSPANTVTSVVFNLTEPPLHLVQTITTGNASCYGINDGYIHLSVTGGVGNYRLFYKRNSTNDPYSEQPVHTDGHTFYVNNLFSDTYSVYILDGHQCYARTDIDTPGGVIDITITQPDKALELNLNRLKSTSGFGRSDGSIAYQVDGGTPVSTSPLSYNVLWEDENGQTLPSIEEEVNGEFITRVENLPQGTYTLTATDKNYVGTQNTCYIIGSIVVDEPAPLTVDIINTATVDCHGETTGELVARVRGGVPHAALNMRPYTFQWYKVVNGVDSAYTNQPDSTLSGLGAGYYKVYVEDGSDPVNTVLSGVFNVTEPPLLVTELKTRNISCFGSNDGFIHIGVSGGVGNYKMFYKGINTDSVYRECPILVDTFYLDSLYSDTYSVYILDGNNCYAKIDGNDIHQIILEQPDTILHVSSVTQKDLSGFGIKNGSITIVIEGGTPNNDSTYNVQWTDELGLLVADTAYFENGKYVSAIRSLDKGEYTVTITDKNHAIAYLGKKMPCFYTDSYTLIEPEELVCDVEESHFITCNGMSDGQLVVYATGGVVNPDTTGLPYKYTWYEEVGGQYLVISHATGETLDNITAGNYQVEITDYSWLENSVTVAYTLVQPDPLEAVATDIAVTCGQKADVSVTVTGGTPPYRYEWSTGDETQSILNTTAGKYLVFVTDSRGCQITATAKITAPSNLDIEGETTDPLCYEGSNGSIELNITGGEAPYSYKWSTGATSKNLSGLTAGVYSVVVTDKGDCSLLKSFTLSEPEALSVDIGEDRTLCAGQELEIAPEVDDPKTKFSWTGPDGFTSTEPSVTVSNDGVYKLTITDSNGCQASDELRITVKDIDISTELVIASLVNVGDTIVAVNISDPEPESMEWLIKESDSLIIVEQSDQFVKMIFTQTGYYSVGLRTHVSDCYQDNIKLITVGDAGISSPDLFGGIDIKNFTVYPNPNSGVFKADVELSKESAIRLRIVNIGTGVVASDTKHSNQKEYSIPYNLSLSAGVYAVILETASGQKITKIIIK